MRGRVLLGLGVVLLIVATVACSMDIPGLNLDTGGEGGGERPDPGGGGGGDTGGGGGGDTGGGGGGGGGATATLTLVNNSSSTVCFVYISPVTWTHWGDDWLGTTETISPGGSRAFNVPAGDYDLRADDCSHNVLDDTRGVTLSGSMTWTISGGGGGGGGGGGTANLTLVNSSSSTVCFVYISPVTWTHWGDDWLSTTETISPGGSRVFNVPAGDYDLRADDCSHNVLDDTRGVSISGSMTWTIY